MEDEYESGRISSDEFLRRIRDLCRFRCEPSVIREAWSNIFRPNDDVCALIPELAAGYRLLLGSNTNELHAQWYCKQFADVFTHFHALVLSHETRARKPKRAFFERCLALAECAPDECVFIDDLSANVESAESCGIHGIVYGNSVNLRARLTELGVSL